MSKDVKANVNKKNKIIIIIAVVISLIILTFLGVNIYSISKGYDNIFNMVQEHKEGLKKSNSSEPKESTLLGDVNCDKVLNNKDLTMLQQYLAGDKKLSSQAQKNADLNNDNIIDDKDLKLLQDKLNNKTTTSDSKDDKSEDNTSKEDNKDNNNNNTSNNNTNNGNNNSQPNNNGQSNNSTPNNNQTVSKLRGDVNCDNEVNIQDVILLQQYIEGWKVDISAQGYVNADINSNGKVDAEDIKQLQQLIAS